jgi:hypothetical protein
VLLGWAFSLLLFQVLHLVVPIRGWVAIPLFAAGILMSFPSLSAEIRHSAGKPGPTALIWLAGFTLIVVWIASRGMYPVENFDSGLYHLQTIRWINSYPIVPGLGNLHGRLAFNQSFFTYAASLNVAWFTNHARGAANGFLFLVILFQAAQGLNRRSRHTEQGRGAHVLTWAANLLVLPVLGYLALSSDGFSSPTPDLAATLLQLSMFLIFLRSVSEWTPSRETSHFATTALSLLAATAITVKLSTVAFSATMLVACVLFETYRPVRQPSAARSAARLAPAALIIGVWMLRGVILSGCALYPVTIGCLRTGWAVPIDRVMDDANWAYSWAREPGVDWRLVLGNWHWLGSWMNREARDVVGFVFPVVASLVTVLSALALRLYASRKSGSPVGRSDLIILIPVAAGILFWFFTAPDPRFGRVFFWMLSMSGGLLLLASVEPLSRGRAFRVALLGVFLAINAPFFAYVALKGESRISRISLSGWRPIPSPALRPKRTSSGLILYEPASGQRCWDAPLPCTPSFNADLALRVSGRLDRGFADRPPLRRGGPGL